MAAYAALLSLMHTIKQIQSHPRPPISLDAKQVDSLTENVISLQNFLECYSSNGSNEEDQLESRIAYAAYAAEDVIESHIVDQIHAGSTSDGKKISPVDFCEGLHGVVPRIVDRIHARFTSRGKEISSMYLYQDLQRVMQDMDLIKKEVMLISKEKTQVQDQLHRDSSVSAAPVRSVSRLQNCTVVDFGDILNEVVDKLTGQPDYLQIIPIVGMGGIGKTTLAINIYANPLIVQHFDILAWVTISQEYSRRGILQVLCQEINVSENVWSKTREDELGETLYKHLWSRRYLIVMDDVWSVEAWDIVKSFFPDNNNGSKIMITTRLSYLAFQLSGSHGFQMKFLDEEKSWNLFCEIVFGKESCPIELENIGKEIVRNCRGLPLSIVVIGGLLTKSKMTRAEWECTSENLNPLINLENNEHCLQILRMSYKELPIHLKPCFLYMGVFPEDYKIHVSDLTKLWVAEGFLKPIEGKSLEEAAKEYVEELIDRNLILIHELRWNGKARLCKIHDLLRDLCLREAQKQKFHCILRQQDLIIPQGINIERRICIHKGTPEKYSPQIFCALESASLNRSLLLIRGYSGRPPSFSSRLLRVWVDVGYSLIQDLYPLEAISRQINLRYISLGFGFEPLHKLRSSSSRFWNLQILKVVGHIPEYIIAPSEIWQMPQLRHVMANKLELSNPPSQEDMVLENLQTLSEIRNFKLSKEAVERIPNIRKLKLIYEGDTLVEKGLSYFCCNNLSHLQNLESLDLCFESDSIPDRGIFQSGLVRNLNFLHPLKKLTLGRTNFHWEELTTKIGSLPHLEVLKLIRNACIGPEWETVEGQFCSLKFLLIYVSSSLEYWMTDSTHFPRLEHLVLQHLPFLEEIPSSIGDIPTLKSIQLENCRKSAVDSAERIKEEQVDKDNVDLQVQIGD